MRAISLLGCCVLGFCLGCRNEPLPEPKEPAQYRPGGIKEPTEVDLRQPNKFCEVHGNPLQQGVVPIIYGLMKPTNEEDKAESDTFPHANTFYNPGCMEKEPKQARVSFCPECRKARELWMAKRKAAN